jgi:hypothetical protein
MPLGWHISVYRQQGDGSAPASFGARHGTRLAVWQTGWRGLSWLDDLVKRGEAVDLGGNGYPTEFTAKAFHIIPLIRDEPPLAKPYWSRDAGDIVLSGWEGKTTTNAEAIDACRPEEWLLIQAWDES